MIYIASLHETYRKYSPKQLRIIRRKRSLQIVMNAMKKGHGNGKNRLIPMLETIYTKTTQMELR